MVKPSRRSSLRARAMMIGGISLSIFVGVAVLGWLVGWRTVDQYSTALRIAGVGAGVVGMVGAAWGSSPVGERTGGFGRPSQADGLLDLAQPQMGGQSDDGHHEQSFAFLVMMVVVGLLVAGSGAAIQMLFG